MLKISEISKITKVSVRTLQYYDKIGLLKPAIVKENGYRYYNEKSLKKLQLILLYKEIDIPLKTIKHLLDSKNDATKILEEQIKELKAKRNRLDNIIKIAENMKAGELMDFEKFQKQAKRKWGNTEAYKEYEKRGNKNVIDNNLMDLFKEVDSPNFPKKLQEYITKNYYTCTNEILVQLAEMYLTSEFQNNIDSYAGKGSAKKAHDAILTYLKQ